MKVAVIKKNQIENIELKDWLLDGLKSLGGFDVVELTSPKDITADFDRILVFGGDGTMLETVRYAVPFGTAVLGVNLGH
ncbi:MAG: NAD(+)/NADH kinase, partial [Clostridia bacterium]|nr:NAD(+)/NADH kinase [Clostridia bacterium]